MSEHDYKRCTKCEILLSKNKFGKSSRAKDGLQVRCRECINRQRREYHGKNRNEINRRNKEWRRSNLKRCRRLQREYRKTKHGQEVYRQWHLKHKYGITLEQHEQIYLDQNGCCALCDEPVAYDKAVTDHDHKTGKVRGLLCQRCNLGLGAFGDTYGGIMRAVKYLRGGR